MAGIVEQEAGMVVRWRGMSRMSKQKECTFIFRYPARGYFDDCGMGGYVVDGKEKGSDTWWSGSCGQV